MWMIEKALNNNIALAFDEIGVESIVVGTGIGYKGRKGSIIDQRKITKVYKIESNDKISKLLEEIPSDYIEVSEAILQEGIKMIDKKINPFILLTLSDHIKFSIERTRKGVQVSNLLIWEIPLLYPLEFKAGLIAVEMINEKFGVVLPKDEASFLALHFVNAQFESPNMNETIQITEIIGTVIEIINYSFHIELNESSLPDSRFITHLRYLVMKQNKKDQSPPLLRDPLLSVIKEKYAASYQSAHKIKQFLFERYHWTINEAEVVYLAIHIEKLIMAHNGLK